MADQRFTRTARTPRTRPHWERDTGAPRYPAPRTATPDTPDASLWKRDRPLVSPWRSIMKTASTPLQPAGLVRMVIRLLTVLPIRLLNDLATEVIHEQDARRVSEKFPRGTSAVVHRSTGIGTELGEVVWSAAEHGHYFVALCPEGRSRERHHGKTGWHYISPRDLGRYTPIENSHPVPPT